MREMPTHTHILDRTMGHRAPPQPEKLTREPSQPRSRADNSDIGRRVERDLGEALHVHDQTSVLPAGAVRAVAVTAAPRLDFEGVGAGAGKGVGYVGGGRRYAYCGGLVGEDAVVGPGVVVEVGRVREE